MGTDIEPTSEGPWQTLADGEYRHEIAEERGLLRHRIACRDGRAGDWVQTGSIAQLDAARAADVPFLDILPVHTVFICEEAPAAQLQAKQERRRRGGTGAQSTPGRSGGRP